MKDNIKNYLGWAGLLLALVLCYGVWSYVGSYRESLPVMNTFGVSGEGKVVAVPDVAEFTFSVTAEGGKDVAALQKQVTDKNNQAIKFIKSKKVADKDIQTTGYNISPRYNDCVRPMVYGAPVAPCVQQIIGYTVTQTTQVKVRDFTTTGDLLSGIVTAGANQVSSLNFTIDDPEGARAEARAKAIAQARAKAEAVANAAGFRIGRLVSMEEGGNYPMPYYAKGLGMGGDVMASEAAPAPTIEPGSQEVNVTVNLRYEIK